MKDDEIIDNIIKVHKELYQDQTKYILSSAIELYKEIDILYQTKKSIPKLNFIKKYKVNKRIADIEKEIDFLIIRKKRLNTFDEILIESLKKFKENIR